MKQKLYIFILILSTHLWAMPALDKGRVYTQPDGEKIVLHVRGDGAFHWFESEGNVVVYNPNDGYYYKATVDPQKGIIATGVKMKASKSRTLKRVSAQERDALKQLHRKARSLPNHPK